MLDKIDKPFYVLFKIKLFLVVRYLSRIRFARIEEYGELVNKSRYCMTLIVVFHLLIFVFWIQNPIQAQTLIMISTKRTNISFGNCCFVSIIMDKWMHAQ